MNRRLAIELIEYAKQMQDIFAEVQASFEALIGGRIKNRDAAALGKLGAAARYKNLTPEQRSQVARDAVNERWRRARAKAAA